MNYLENIRNIGNSFFEKMNMRPLLQQKEGIASANRIIKESEKTDQLKTLPAQKVDLEEKKELTQEKTKKTDPLSVYQQIKQLFPDGITVAIYTNYDDQNSNNKEFKRASDKFAKTYNSIGLDEKNELKIGMAKPVKSIEEVTQFIQKVYEALSDEYYNQTDAIVCSEEIVRHLKINRLALFSHGISSGISLDSKNKYTLGNKTDDQKKKLRTFVDEIKSALSEDVKVLLFACNTGRETDGTENEGIWYIDTANKNDGDTSFAASLSKELGSGASVYGHLSAGHTVENYSARVFGKDSGKETGGTHVFDLLFDSSFIENESRRLNESKLDTREAMMKFYKKFLSNNSKDRETGAAFKSISPQMGQLKTQNSENKEITISLGSEMFADIDNAKLIMQSAWTAYIKDHHSSFFKPKKS